MAYWIMTSLSIFLFLLPKPLRIAFAKGLAFFLFRIMKYKRRLMHENLKRVFADKYSDKKLEDIAYQSILSLCYTLVEFVSARDGRLYKNVKVENREVLDEILGRGKGAFVVCAHMGSWEAMGGAMTTLFAPTYVVVKKVGGPSMDRFVNEMRARNKFLVIDRKEGKGSAVKSMVKAFNNNCLVGFVMDQSRPGEPKLPFFGYPAKTNTSLAALAKRFDVPLVAAYNHRRAYGEHTLYVMPEIHLIKTDDEESDIIENTIMFNKVIEEIILRCPEQYFWIHNRWKA